MSWTPTDEQVEKAARAEFESVMAAIGSDDTWDEHADRLEQEAYLAQARAVLVAVGPMIAAQALRDAAAVQDEESARIREAYRQHNVSRDPNRPPRRPDLNVWSNADEATAHRLRARADTIEKEAGR